MNRYGKKSEFRLKARCRQEKTVIADSFFTAPFKIMKPFYDERRKMAELCLMNTSPGVLAGDDYRMDVELQEGARLHLYAQSAQKLFDMNGDGAVQNTRFFLQSGCVLEYYPMPVIPYAGSRYSAGCDIRMSGGSTLLFREILAAGRCHHGELFAYDTFRSRMQITVEDRLALAENTVLVPSAQELAGLGFYEGYTHCGTVYFAGAGVCAEARDAAAELLRKGEAGLRFGVSLSHPAVMCVKMLGHSAEDLLDASDRLRGCLEPFYL